MCQIWILFATPGQKISLVFFFYPISTTSKKIPNCCMLYHNKVPLVVFRVREFKRQSQGWEKLVWFLPFLDWIARKSPENHATHGNFSPSVAASLLIPLTFIWKKTPINVLCHLNFLTRIYVVVTFCAILAATGDTFLTAFVWKIFTFDKIYKVRSTLFANKLWSFIVLFNRNDIVSFY